MQKTRLFAVKLWENIREHEFDKLLSIISTEKYDRIIRSKDVFESQRILLAELLVRWILHAKLGLDINCIEFGISAFGKPFIKGLENINFNLSHSNEWVVCAFSPLDIGVDIEKISSIKLEIAKRFFTKEEYDRILSKDAHERIVYFYELWTLKESYIKALGLGLTIPLNSFSFNICENGVEFKGENLMPKFGFRLIEFHKDYRIAVCFKENIPIDDRPEILDAYKISDDFISGQIKNLGKIKKGLK